MKKSSKSLNSTYESKSLLYSLRKRSVSSNAKYNIEKMFAQMKKELINEISKVAEDIFNEHKNKIINAYNESKINQNTPDPIKKEDKKALKFKKSKKNKDNIFNEKAEDIQCEENEKQIEKINVTSTPKEIKSKKAITGNKKSKKKKSRSYKKKNITVAIEREKTEASSFNEIAKVNETVPKVIKKEKIENKELINETIIIGKKTKRGKICYSLITSPENKNEIEEKKLKKSIVKKNNAQQ